VFKLDARKIPNGTVLLMGIGHRDTDDEPGGDTRGRTRPKIYTYALLKAGGLWYVIGAGRVPQAAGWGAIERWLSKDGRFIESIRIATQWDALYQWYHEDGPAPAYPRPACGASPVDASQATE